MKTALYDRHLALGAKMVPFADYVMPIQYSGIQAEHHAVRNHAGLFDVSHMGEVMISGSDAESFLQNMTINDVRKMKIGQAQYSAMCNQDGGIIDDLLIYKYESKFMCVINASNRIKDVSWLKKHVQGDVNILDESDSISLVALQGPESRKILIDAGFTEIESLGFYHFIESSFNGFPITIARTGYTGELGYEIYCSELCVVDIWDVLMETGTPHGLVPAGLGARDTLRMEMKYCLYGNDINEATHPYEAGLGWITKPDKGEFIGKESILTKKAHLSRRLVCLEMQERAVPRSGYPIFVGEASVGNITSGTQSPSLQKGIGLAYINLSHTKPGSEVEVEIRGHRKKAIVVKPPFYKNGTGQD